MQTVVRALRTMRTVGRNPGGLTLQELADELALPVSSMHRLLSVLTREGFLARTPHDRRYVLGAALHAMSSETSAVGLRRIVEPRLARLSRETSETVFVAEMVGDRVVCIALSEGTRSLRFFVRLGQQMPLHAASSARVLLAERPDDEVRALVSLRPLARYTPKTLSTIGDLLAHLGRTRARGYDVSAEELDEYAWAIAAPLRGRTGAAVASLTITSPLAAVQAESRRASLVSQLLATATEISAELGQQS